MPSLTTKVGTSFVGPKAVYGKDGGSWRYLRLCWVRVNGQWRFVWENLFTHTVTNNRNGLHLRNEALNAGWDGTARVEITIASGVVINGHYNTQAVTINGSWPMGVTLINHGTIAGRGGPGGGGGAATNQGYNGGGGSNGWHGIGVASPVTIFNYGTIAGGGGGGGGGAGAWGARFTSLGKGDSYWTYRRYGGGGGGAGRSNNRGSAGGGGGAGHGGNGNGGGNGWLSGQGGGGSGINNGGVHSGNGGGGGGWGANGAAGAGSNFTTSTWPSHHWRSGGGGGGAGLALFGNRHVTWGATGTRYGGIQH